MFKITILTVHPPQHTHLLYFVYSVDVLVGHLIAIYFGLLLNLLA